MARRRLTVVQPPPVQRHSNAQHPRRWHPLLDCSICGELIRRWQPFNFDHEIPMARGGRRGKVNKRPAHQLCNAVKGDRYPFSLRTSQDRLAVQARVTVRTYRRLQAVWRGE